MTAPPLTFCDKYWLAALATGLFIGFCIGFLICGAMFVLTTDAPGKAAFWEGFRTALGH
jgi:hypothetical protein